MLLWWKQFYLLDVKSLLLFYSLYTLFLSVNYSCLLHMRSSTIASWYYLHFLWTTLICYVDIQSSRTVYERHAEAKILCLLMRKMPCMLASPYFSARSFLFFPLSLSKLPAHLFLSILFLPPPGLVPNLVSWIWRGRKDLISGFRSWHLTVHSWILDDWAKPLSFTRLN